MILIRILPWKMKRDRNKREIARYDYKIKFCGQNFKVSHFLQLQISLFPSNFPLQKNFSDENQKYTFLKKLKLIKISVRIDNKKEKK